MSASKNRLYHRLQTTAHRMQKSADRAVMAAADITTAQAAVLMLVATEGAVTQREVARRLGVNESAMTAMVRRLLALGLLERSRDQEDVRAWRLQSNEAGRAALKRVQQPFKHVNETIEAALGADDIARLSEYLDRLAAAFASDPEP